jgi:CheY-like chemotaxis protein
MNPKVKWYCGHYVGAPKWQNNNSPADYEPDECCAEGEIELDEDGVDDWNEGCFISQCDVCGAELTQDMGHFRLTGEGKKVLVIDDDLSRLKWFNEMLKTFECNDVTLAYNAEEALACFRKEVFDLVFFDHDLGFGMDGSQLAYHILSHTEEFKAPKAIFIHTCNPEGAANIAAKFKSTGIRYYSGSYDYCVNYRQDFESTTLALLNGLTIPEGVGY